MYLSAYINVTDNFPYTLHSQDLLTALVPRSHTEFGKKAFMVAALTTWNNLQEVLKNWKCN